MEIRLFSSFYALYMPSHYGLKERKKKELIVQYMTDLVSLFWITTILKSKDLIFPTISWMEKAMAPHSSTLAWKIPWTEEPGRLQSMGSQRVGHNWVTSLWLYDAVISSVTLKRRRPPNQLMYIFNQVGHCWVGYLE